MSEKEVLLDFNGTLFFDSPYHELAWKAISEELRDTEMSDEELTDHMHRKNNEKVIEYILGKHIEDEENKRYSLKKEAMYRDMCITHPDSFRLVYGVEAFLNQLVERNIPFTIANTSIKQNIGFFVEHFHLDHWLDPALNVYDDGSYTTKVESFMKELNVFKFLQVIVWSLKIVSVVSPLHMTQEFIVSLPSIIAMNLKKYEQFPCVSAILKDFDEFPWALLN